MDGEKDIPVTKKTLKCELGRAVLPLPKKLELNNNETQLNNSQARVMAGGRGIE